MWDYDPYSDSSVSKDYLHDDYDYLFDDDDFFTKSQSLDDDYDDYDDELPF